MLVLIDKSLIRIEVFLVLRQHSTGVASCLVKTGHPNPLIPVKVKFFTIRDHLLVPIAAANHIDIPVSKRVMSGETRPPDMYVLFLFDTICD